MKIIILLQDFAKADIIIVNTCGFFTSEKGIY